MKVTLIMMFVITERTIVTCAVFSKSPQIEEASLSSL